MRRTMDSGRGLLLVVALALIYTSQVWSACIWSGTDGHDSEDHCSNNGVCISAECVCNEDYYGNKCETGKLIYLVEAVIWCVYQFSITLLLVR